MEWPRWHSLPVSEPGWGWRRWGSGFKETPWLPRGWGQRVGDAGPAGPPQKGEVPFLSPSSACRASAPTSKSCRHRQPRLAASLEDSHFWKSLLCHRSSRPSAAHPWGPSGSAHLPRTRLPTFRMVPLPTGRTRPAHRAMARPPPRAWAHPGARRNEVRFEDFPLRRRSNPALELNKIC